MSPKFEPQQEDTAKSIWTWAGFRTMDEFEKQPSSARRLWFDRWRARCEAQLRDFGRPVHSPYFAPEHLDDVLKRLGLDSRGCLIDRDPLGLDGPARVEDHTPTDTRPWEAQAADAESRMRAKIDGILERNAIRREQTV